MAVHTYNHSDQRLLAHIKDMIDEDRIALKMNGNAGSDMLEGRICALKELCVELGLATWEELRD